MGRRSGPRRATAVRAGTILLAGVVLSAGGFRASRGAVDDVPLRRERIAAVQGEAVSLEAAAARARTMRAHVSSLASRAATLEQRLLLAENPADAIRRISALAERSRLRITRLTPAAVRPRPPLFEWVCTLAAAGAYADVRTFFELATEVEPVLRIDAFTVKRTADAADGLLALEVVFEALTNNQPTAAKHGDAFVERAETVSQRARSDPFAEAQREPAAGNNAGLGSVRVADVTLQGVVAGGDRVSALLAAPNRRVYVAHAGTELADGSVKSIDRSGVTFALHTEGAAGKQIVLPLVRGRR